MSKMKTANELRQEFIDFFKDKEHEYTPSWPVIPQDDPTLLFTNAGMNQFKDILLGKGNISYKRAVNSQRCIRVSGKHNDLEEVGHDTYHHTFFEMLGNWSFGDYYKKEAIEWGWELLTQKWKLPKDKLYASVYTDDDEAAELWPKVTDIPKERVLRFGNKDNFWEMGATGPCGPCSEIHIDLGEDYCDMKEVEGHTCGVNGDCGRFIELWNLVFVQYYRDETGKLNPLPKKHVDTGMGFERIVSVIQGVYDNYKTDVFTPILKAIEDISGVNYQECSDIAPFHVIADHIRMLSFSIGDGGMPANEGRGYVIRRILRRAARYGRKLNLHKPFLHQLVPVVIETLGDAFPEIKSRVEFVQKVIKSEEDSFNSTLDRGLELFEQLSNKLLKNNIKIIPGKEAFKLYDTFGFPYDLTHVLAEEKNMDIDKPAFEAEMEKQRERARQSGKFIIEEDTNKDWTIIKDGVNSVFVGYEKLSTDTQVTKYAISGDTIQIILAETPFYAESGGQIGDTGEIIIGEDKLFVTNTVKNGEEIIHICKNDSNIELSKNDVTATVNNSKRREIMANHTATHLLHTALREVLGAHVQQSGSLVETNRFRFDFSHFEKVSEAQLQEIEQIVNEKVRQNLNVTSQITSIDKAKEMGAMALFGEKYGNEVRMISIADYSLELCGGTHVSETGQIGNIIITGESSIASGIRRIEAVSGKAAFELIQKRNTLVKELSVKLNAKESDISSRLNQLLSDKKLLEKELNESKQSNILADSDNLVKNAQIINGIKLVTTQYEDMDLDLLKKLGDDIRIKAKSIVGLLINKLSTGKLNFVCVVSDDLIKVKNLKAGDLVREVAKITGGGGGGRPHMATAGGNDANKIDEAIKWLKDNL